MKTSFHSLPALPATNVFRPSRLRFFAFRILMMFAAYQTGFTLFQLLSSRLYGVTYPREAWLTSSAAFILVFSLSLVLSCRKLKEDYAIRFTNGVIDGPSGALNRRTQFAFVRLDKARSQRLTLLNLLFQYRFLWSLDGQKIVLFTYAFPPAKLEALYEKLGFSVDA